MGTAFDFSRMSRLSAIVVGVGALGSEVVRQLALLGVGSLVLVDPDRVEATDGAKSLFFRATDSPEGMPKVAAVSSALSKWFPDTFVQTLECEVADAGYQALAGADILFSCVDSRAARLEVAYVASQLSLAVCDGGISDTAESHGRASLLLGGVEACFGCLLSPKVRHRLMESADRPVLSCLREPASTSEIRRSVPTLASLTAALQVELAMRRLAGEGVSRSQSVECQTSFPLGMRTITHTRSDTCPFHRPPEQRVAGSYGDSPAQWLDQAPPESVLLFDWPICVCAHCPDCGAQWRPMMRLAKFRREPRCRGCGGANCRAVEVLEYVKCDSAWARYTFERLAQPDRHLFRVRAAAAL